MAVVWNPSDKDARITLSNNNMTAAASSALNNKWASCRATEGKSSGKWYWEITLGNPAIALAPGIASKTANILQNWSGATSDSYCVQSTAGVYNNGSCISGGAKPTFSAGDVLGFALDCDAGTLEFYRNNSLYFTATGIRGKIAGNIYPVISLSYYGGSGMCTVNFGGSLFKYTPPDGFNPFDWIPGPNTPTNFQGVLVL